MTNQALPLRSVQANAAGNRPSLAGARDASAVTRVQPMSAPNPEVAASAATSFPAQAACGKIVPNAATNGAPLPTSPRWETRPMTAAETTRYTRAAAPVPSSEARPTLRGGSFTRLAMMAAVSTPMNENSATPAAIPIAEYRLPPEALNAPKFALVTKNQPTTPTNSSGRYFSTTVMFWIQAVCLIPARFIAAGIHNPTRAIPQFPRPDGLMLNRAST